MSPAPDDLTWPSLGVVIPVYNEEAGIDRAVRAVLAALEDYPGETAVIAVDDGSTDRSLEILERLSQEPQPLDVVRHSANAGYGQALRTGARRAQQRGLAYVAFIDSDLTNPPTDLLKIGALADEGHAYIKASRFVPGGDMSAVPLSRRVVSRAGNLVAQALFATRVKDVTNGFRAAQTQLICSLPTRDRGFSVIVEELAHALEHGIEPVEFPTSLSARGANLRRSAFSYSASTIWGYLRHPLRAWVRRLGARRRLHSPRRS